MKHSSQECERNASIGDVDDDDDADDDDANDGEFVVEKAKPGKETFSSVEIPWHHNCDDDDAVLVVDEMM